MYSQIKKHMAGDIFTFIASYFSAFLSLLFFLIKIVLIVGLFIFILYVLAVIIGVAIDVTKDVLSTSIKWVMDVAFVLGVLLCTFYIFVFIFWAIYPSSIYLDLNTNTHNSEIDLSFDLSTIAIEGNYVDTNNGYLMKPNLPFSLPVIPELKITKKDDTHIKLLGLNFVEKQPSSIIGHPHISNPNGVYTFVPDKG